MKKILFVTAILIASITYGQIGEKLKGLKLGLHGGMPIGNSKNNFDFNVGADVSFMHFLNDGFGIGVITGFDMYKIKKSDDPYSHKNGQSYVDGLNDD